MKLLFVASVLLTFAIINGAEWIDSANNFYQIYPKSFKSTKTGDNAIGTLKGIEEQLDYLVELGINAVWLSPIFKSPQADGGYDISNFREIDPMFGTMAEFESLAENCEKKNIKLILDFVPNHSSDEHEWFEKSVKKEGDYKDYYVWHEGIENPEPTEKPFPPNNWVSVFGGSAWEWNDVRKEYYLHQFHKKQPDLNFRNPKVVEEMKKILEFWLDKKASGFRVDAVPHLFEVEPTKEGTPPNEKIIYPDEPISGHCEPTQHCSLNHIYTVDQPKTIEMVYEWRKVVDAKKGILMTEAYTSMENIVKYYGNDKVNGSHVPFNFELLTGINKDTNGRTLKRIAESYMGYLPHTAMPNWVLGNHDQRRIASRLGSPERAELFTFFTQTMPGHAITYQGEEIMMPDVDISWEDTQDPQACNTNSSVYKDYSRDPARTPMRWNDTTYGGFSSGKPWLPMGDNIKEINVATQKAADTSYLKTYMELIKLRQKSAFKEGRYASAATVDNDIYSYVRVHNDEKYMIVLNFGKEDKKFKLSSGYNGLEEYTGEIVLTTTKSNHAKAHKLKFDGEETIQKESGLIMEIKSGVDALFKGFILVIASVLVTVFRN